MAFSQFTSEVYIYDAVRTPKGRVRRNGGTLSGVPPYELLAGLLRELTRRGLDPEAVGDTVIGTSTAAGDQGGDIARSAILWAGWPDTTPGGVVSRLCCSGFDAIGGAAARVAGGVEDLVVAGGVESMSRVPMLADTPAFAYDGQLQDRTGFVTIGVSADLTAADHGYTRGELDAYAVTSHQRSLAAPDSPSVIAVQADDKVLLTRDEGARADASIETFGQLPALFADDPSWARVARRLPDSVRPDGGLHTVATAPQLADGACAVVLGSRKAGDLLGLTPRGRILAAVQTAVRSPRLTAALAATGTALSRTGLTPGDLDVIEANESFAVSPLLLTREFDLDPATVNPRGGAVATGHPLGASGGCLLVNALDELEARSAEFGLLAIPGGLGLGAAIVITRN